MKQLNTSVAFTGAVRKPPARGWSWARSDRLKQPLWRCPRCRRQFAHHNQSHACGRHDLQHHLKGKPPLIHAFYNAVLERVRSCGPVVVLPEKTRIAFQVRMSFAQVTPRQQWLDGHVVLARRLEHPRFRRIETISPRNHVHHFRLMALTDVDQDVQAWLREAYAVGQQLHLDSPRGRRTSA